MAHYSLFNKWIWFNDGFPNIYATVFSEELLSIEEQMQHPKGPSSDECVKNI